MADRKILAALIFLLFADSLSGRAANSLTTPFHWEFAGWYGGGCYPNVEFDPHVKDRVYLVSDVSGIWKSDDLGEHWSFINEGLEKLNVALIAIAPSDSKVLYAGTKAGLFRSLDEGAHWAACDTAGSRIRFERPASHRSIAVSPADAGMLAVGTAGGDVFFSKDSGMTWNTLGGLRLPPADSGPITALVWSADGLKLYAASSQGLAVYPLPDEKWRVLDNAPKKITDLLVVGISNDSLYAAGQKTLFISEDAGESWHATSEIPQGTSYRVAVVAAEKMTRILVAWVDGWKGEIVESDDGGHIWKPATQKMIPDKILNPTRIWAGSEVQVNALKINPFDPNVLFRTDFWGVWRSDDGGKNWKEKINGAPNTVGSDVVVTEDGTVYAATMDNGLLKSADGGKHYETLFPAKGYKKEINGHVWRILTAGSGKIIATSSPWDKNVNQVILSNDGGKSFEIINEGLPAQRPKANTMWWEGFARALAVDPQNTNNIYLGIDGDDGGGFFVSNNAGRHWKYPKIQPPCKRIYNALAVDPSNPNRLFWGGYGKDGGIYLSEDKGDSWKLVFNQMFKIFDLAIGKDGVIYVGGEKQGACLYLSQDHGKTWKLLKKFSEKGSVEAICLLPGDGKKMALSSHQWDELANGRVHFSNDGGKNWVDITGDLPPGSGMAAIAYDKKSGYLYGIRYAGSVYRFDLSLLN